MRASLMSIATVAIALLRVDLKPEQTQPRLFVQSLSDESEAVGIVKCPANLVGLKHVKLEVTAGRSGMIHQRTSNPLSVPRRGDKESSYLIAQQ